MTVVKSIMFFMHNDSFNEGLIRLSLQVGMQWRKQTLDRNQNYWLVSLWKKEGQSLHAKIALCLDPIYLNQWQKKKNSIVFSARKCWFLWEAFSVCWRRCKNLNLQEKNTFQQSNKELWHCFSELALERITLVLWALILFLGINTFLFHFWIIYFLIL